MSVEDILLGSLIGLITGGAVAFVIQNIVLKKRTAKIIADAEHDGEALKKDKILQAKERFLKLKEALGLKLDKSSSSIELLFCLSSQDNFFVR